MIEHDPLQGNAVLVDALGSALRRGGNALGSVPDLLKRILREGSWREFVTQRGEHVVHDRLIDFVAAAPLRGLGASRELIERVVGDDAEALLMWRRALKERPGPKSSRNNITRTTNGTSRAYALERLERDAPALHAEVLAKRMSAHAAMVQAGFRPPTFSVRADSAESIAATLRRQLPEAMLAEVADRLR